MTGHPPRGVHALADGFGADYALLNNVLAIEVILRKALDMIGATILDTKCKRFMPQGCTVLALLAESHASVHTYPEHGVYMVDVFTCGDDLNASAAAAAIATDLGGDYRVRTIARGATKKGAQLGAPFDEVARV